MLTEQLSYLFFSFFPERAIHCAEEDLLMNHMLFRACRTDHKAAKGVQLQIIWQHEKAKPPDQVNQVCHIFSFEVVTVLIRKKQQRNKAKEKQKAPQPRTPTTPNSQKRATTVTNPKSATYSASSFAMESLTTSDNMFVVAPGISNNVLIET